MKGRFLCFIRKYISTLRCKQFSDWFTPNINNCGIGYLLSHMCMNWHKNSIFQTLQVCHRPFASVCYSYARWYGVTIRGPITEVKQLWAWLVLGWVTSKLHWQLPKMWCLLCSAMAYVIWAYKNSQSATQLIKRLGCALSCLCDWCT